MDSDANSSSGSLQSLPSGVLAHLVNDLLSASEHASLRTASSELQASTDESVASAQVAPSDLAQLAALLGRLSALKDLTLLAPPAANGFASYTSYTQLQSHVPALVSALAAVTCLTSLTLSAEVSQQLGALRRAHMEDSQHAVSATSSSSQQSEPAPTPLAAVHWVPSWLASAPNVQKLVVKTSDATSSNSSGSNSAGSGRGSGKLNPQPMWLWLQPKAWASQLTCLQLRGPLRGPLTHVAGLPQLTRLQQLAITGCRLMPSAAQHLLQQLASCQALTQLVLSSNDMQQLPKQGWQAVAGLKELDVSHNMLLELPVGLSSLSALTALQVHHNSLTSLPAELCGLGSLAHLNASHNWLSGCRATLPSLLEAWSSHLAVLELDNVSDKRGELALPAQLAHCSCLRKLSLRDNFAVDADSLASVLLQCKGLGQLLLSKEVLPGASLEALLPAMPQTCTVLLD